MRSSTSNFDFFFVDRRAVYHQGRVICPLVKGTDCWVTVTAGSDPVNMPLNEKTGIVHRALKRGHFVHSNIVILGIIKR